jgi:hypothetical protein
MKNLVCSFIALIVCIAGYADTIPGGNLSGVWTLAHSPYLINGTTEVLHGNTLTIEAGVTVKWLGSYTMHIQGQILAMGTATDSILFAAEDPETGFRSIRFIDTPTPNDTSRFEYCIFRYGKVYGDFPDNCGGAIGMVNVDKVVVDHCLFDQNEAIDAMLYPNPSGGAIALATSSPVIRNSRFTNNVALAGGAIICSTESMAKIINNEFAGNTAPDPSGGAAWGQGVGGALCIYGDSHPQVSYNTFHDNLAERSGGAIVCNNQCEPQIDHNLIYDNSAGVWGGGIELEDNCRPVLINNTIADNQAVDKGGGINILTVSEPEIINTILWGNDANGTGNQVYIASINSVADFYYCDIQGGQDAIGGYPPGAYQNCIDEDPLFEGSDTCNYNLMPDSPCIDEGDPDCEDPDGTVCDMGAFWCNYTGVGIPPIKIPNPGLAFDLYPSPAYGIVDCRLSIVDCRSITLNIVDLYGREVRTLAVEEKAPGEYTMRMDVADLPVGVYLLRLRAGGESVTRKIVKL